LKKLILHPGWSKTGTSAIQKALNSCSEYLVDNGVLYSKKLQQIDNAHHKFALAFGSRGPYTSPLSAGEAINLLNEEFSTSECHTLILSSELSPIYFRHRAFEEFAKTTFDEVELVFTIRDQASLLLSLFSQLVTDPNVRYRESIFLLFMKNIEDLNFYEKISAWLEYVSKDSIKVLPYSRKIVSDFFALLGIDEAQVILADGVNKSIHPKYLIALQDQCRNLDNADDFRKRKDHVLNILRKASESKKIEYPIQNLFSVQEQKSVDSYYHSSNEKISTEFLEGSPLFSKESYKHIFAYAPAAFKLIKDASV
jgi:hypothetical protein